MKPVQIIVWLISTLVVTFELSQLLRLIIIRARDLDCFFGVVATRAFIRVSEISGSATGLFFHEFDRRHVQNP